MRASALAGASHAPISVFYLPELRQAEFKPAQKARADMMQFYFDVIEEGVNAGLFQSPAVSVSAEQVFQLTETIIIAQNKSAMGKPAELAEQTADFALRGLLVKPANCDKARKAAMKIEQAMT